MFLVCVLYKPHLAPFKLFKLHTHSSIKGPFGSLLSTRGFNSLGSLHALVTKR